MIQLNQEWLQENGKYKCSYCNKEYSKKGICTHIWRSHTEKGIEFTKNHDPNIGFKNGTRKAWNKGLTKEIDERVAINGINAGNALKGKIGHKFSKEEKQKISNSMKTAHSEGRAWNIGMSRWNNEPSYPEKFFMQVIANEFNDKNYLQEYNVGIYSIDFAWIKNKLAIEIDGGQHERFEEYKARDIRKDKYLKSQGWKVLRIKWIDMYNDTKQYIQIAKDFINNMEV